MIEIRKQTQVLNIKTFQKKTQKRVLSTVKVKMQPTTTATTTETTTTTDDVHQNFIRETSL